MRGKKKQGIIHAVLRRDGDQWDRWFHSWDAYFNDTFSPDIEVVFVEEY